MKDSLKRVGILAGVFVLSACQNTAGEISESKAKKYLKQIIEKVKKETPSTITIKEEYDQTINYKWGFENQDNVKSYHYHDTTTMTFDIENLYVSSITHSQAEVLRKLTHETETSTSDFNTWQYVGDDGFYYKAKLFNEDPNSGTKENSKEFTKVRLNNKLTIAENLQLRLADKLFINGYYTSDNFVDELVNNEFLKSESENTNVPAMTFSKRYYSSENSAKSLTILINDIREVEKENIYTEGLSSEDADNLKKVAYQSTQKFSVSNYYYVTAYARTTVAYCLTDEDVYKTVDYYTTSESNSNIKKTYPNLSEFVDKTDYR